MVPHRGTTSSSPRSDAFLGEEENEAFQHIAVCKKIWIAKTLHKKRLPHKKGIDKRTLFLLQYKRKQIPPQNAHHKKAG